MSSNPERFEAGRTRPFHARILGIDPGSIVTGWGLIGGTPSRPEWLDAGEIRLGRAGDDLPGRLFRLQQDLAALLERLGPTCAAVESPYHGANARSAFQLAQARGVALAVLAATGLEITEYTPASVKKAVTGNGRAPKQQVRSMVGRLLGHPGHDLPEDLADALAVALCHGATRRHLDLVERAQRGRPESPHRR